MIMTIELMAMIMAVLSSCVTDISVYIEVKNCGYIRENIMISKGEYKWETADTLNPQMMKCCCIQVSLS